MDWASRKVLSWRISRGPHERLLRRALTETLQRFGPPEILNTDQGSQFTNAAFLEPLRDAGVQISMDVTGCWRNNVFIERLWRSIKYDEVHLNAYASVSEAKAGILRYVAFCNQRRPHSSLDRRTPDAVYATRLPVPRFVSPQPVPLIPAA